MRPRSRFALACLMAMLVWHTAQRGPLSAQTRSSTPVRRTFASIPFVDMTGRADDAWMGRGIADLVASVMAQQPETTLVALDWTGDTAAQARVESDPTAAALRRCAELGVDLLVGGTYERVGNQLRVTARMLDVAGEAPVAEVSLDGSVDDLFALQDRVALALVEKLTGQSGPVAQPAPPRSTVAGGALGGTAGFPALAPGAPPPPVAPEVIRRSPDGHATIRAARLERPLTLDGSIDERIYEDVPALTDLIQVEPDVGAPATEKTEAWIFFDDENVYISARAWDSTPESNWIANEMRRDSFNILRNENIGFAIDTFYDRRNSNLFNVTPLGGRMDGQVTNERDYNGDWNPVWDLRTGRFAGGWSFEARIPFKSLRHRPGRAQVWGFQFRRDVRWKNETSFLIPLDQGLGRRGLFQASQYPTLVGLEAPRSGTPLEIKPYLIGDVSSNLTSSPIVSNALGGNAGIDVVKWGVTQNLTTDFTLGTDFAQVEADEQQVNLTRFSLFFPEKREFFLENQGAFQFGTGGGRGPGGGSQDAPILFYSRRIGLNGGLEVPIVAGGRLTGRAGPFTLGIVNIQTDDEPTADALGTNFSVFRVRRDLFRRSSFGGIFTNRSVSTQTDGPGSNQAYGVDLALAFFDNLSVSSYWAQTKTTGVDSEDTSYSADLRYNGDRYGVIAEHLFIDRNFSPEVGFLRRDDMRKSFGSFRFSPRPRSIDAIRKLSWEGSYNHITDASGFVVTREAQGLFNIELNNSDQFDAGYLQTYDFLKNSFEIADDIVIPVGGYDFYNATVDYTFGSQRRVSGRLGAEHGSFYDGTKTTVSIGGSGRGPFGGGRIELSPQLSVEPGMSLNWIDLPQGDFTTTLVTTRATFTMTPLMFVSALSQYNSSNDALSTNIRFRWEYQPGSELFVVYNEQRDTLVPTRFPALQNRAFIVKVNRLFRF